MYLKDSNGNTKRGIFHLLAHSPKCPQYLRVLHLRSSTHAHLCLSKRLCGQPSPALFP